MVLWVVIMILPCLHVCSHFLRALVCMHLSGFVLGAWKLLKRGLEGEDLLQRVFSQSSSHIVFLKRAGGVG